MIDSVLKGTGNSRFLKSAVPAGTSWADALAMLQAGTFPIDFNGINTEGFQQVGTPLNKVNLLKDATAAQIGLPPSTTPDGMFQALGNTGELHVWRKTVVTSNDVPAGYTLGAGEQTTLIIKSQYGSGTQYANVEYGNTCAVYDNGEPYIPNSTTTSNFTVTNSSTLATLNSTLKGKFCKFHAVSGSNRLTVSDGVFFIPSNATFQNEIPTSGDTKITVDVAQKVNAYPLTPAGTTTTYPVSTNPNAYQEGDDAKAAGYVLGDAVAGNFYMGIPRNSYQNTYTYSASLSVSDDGTVSLANPSTATSSQWSPLSTDTINSTLVGKFVQWTCQDPNNLDTKYPFNASPSPIVFIPSDAKITVTMPDSNERFTLSKYQPVTGYAAIPAGTTIEYLGKLGDKARVQVVSYVGTGTYGESNKNSLTFDFPPKILLIAMAQLYANQTYTGILYPFAGYGSSLLGADRGYVYSLLCNRNGNSVSWWNKDDYGNQLNVSGYKYTAIAIG